ncbi:hypothetical protein N0V90_011840 [Kalmusia sp. IMI 367209]|nr:hypothetical protein N0V90_011840 [Kalmusia sp. IMI 367209]
MLLLTRLATALLLCASIATAVPVAVPSHGLALRQDVEETPGVEVTPEVEEVPEAEVNPVPTFKIPTAHTSIIPPKAPQTKVTASSLWGNFKWWKRSADTQPIDIDILPIKDALEGIPPKAPQTKTTASSLWSSFGWWKRGAGV